jgi:hypothetical protein
VSKRNDTGLPGCKAVLGPTLATSRLPAVLSKCTSVVSPSGSVSCTVPLSGALSPTSERTAMPTITFNVNGEKSRSIIRETGEVPPSRVHGVIDRGWNVLGAIAQGVTFTAWKHNEIAARQREWHSAVAYIEGIPSFVALADAGGARTLVLVPMLKDNELVGSINIFRQEVRPRRSGERGG